MHTLNRNISIERIALYFLFLLFSLLLFACQDTISEVATMPIKEAAPLADVAMNDSIWRADSTRIWRLWEQYWFYDDNARNDSAIAVCQKMIDIGKPMMEYKFDSTIYEKYAKAYGGIGYNLLQKGRLEEGFKMTSKGFEMITEKFGENHPRNAEMCTGFTTYFQRKGDFEQALNYCDKSYKIRKNYFPGLHYYVGNSYCNYGHVYLEKGDVNSAINYYLKAKENYKLTNPLALVNAYHFLAKAFLQVKDYQKAKENAQENIRLGTEDHEYRGVVFTRQPTDQQQNEWHYFDLPRVYVLLGEANRGLGHLEESITNIQTGIKLAQTQWEKSGDIVAYGWLELGKTFVKMEKPGLAMAAFKKVGPVLEAYSGEGADYSIRAWNEAAALQLQIGHPDSAVYYLQKALHAISPEFDPKDYYQNAKLESIDPSLILLKNLRKKGDALQVLFHKSKDSRRLANSLETYSLAIELTDKMRYSYKWESSKQTLSEQALPIFEGGINTAFKMYEKTNEEKFRSLAFDFAERSKAFTLLENLQAEKTMAFSGTEPGLLEDEENITQEIVMYQRLILEEKLNNRHPDTSKLNYWHNELVNLKRAEDSLMVRLKKQYPEYHRLKYENPQTTIPQLQKELATDETLIEYFLGDTTLYTFTIDRSGLKVHQQKIDSSFFRAIERMRQFSTQPGNEKNWREDYQHFVADSRYLHDILLPPAAKYNQLIIIPDGILNFLPFNLLLTEDPDENTIANSDYRSLPYLIRDHDIRYEYSATLMVESKHTKPRSLWQRLNKKRLPYCGFAPSYGNGDPIASRGETDSVKLAELYPGLLRGELAPLTHNGSEVETASKTLDGLPFTGSAATEKAFKQNAPQAGILHLAMHALTNDIEPLFSQLAFEKTPEDTSEDGRLHAYEMYNMHLNADLAVLSACNTGAGKLQRGEGVMSLSRAFKYAGVPNVVMSLWTASDEPTQKIVSGFFNNLKAGMGKDQALCEAQRNFYKNTIKQEYTHPYYWSTMMLIGDDNPLFYNNILWPYYLIALFAVALALFVWRRNTRQFGQNKISY